MENVYGFIDGSSHSAWTDFFGELGGLQEHQYHTKMILEDSEEILNAKPIEIHVVS